VNIAGMSLSRNEAGGEALTVLESRSVPGEAADQESRRGELHTVQVVRL